MADSATVSDKSSAKPATSSKAKAKQQLPATATLFSQTVKYSLLALVMSVLLSKTLTETYSWGYKGKWIQPKHYLDTALAFNPLKSQPVTPKEIIMSEAELKKHDGKDPKYPTYIAIDGDVYDVSSSTAYNPGGSYHFFAGVDAARAYVTGCFDKHLTHDIRGLPPKHMRSLNYWKEFFSGHETYKYVGKVHHEPIDPESPDPGLECK